jgi:hypothetical protein
MNNNTSFRRIAAITTIVSAPMALANVFLVLLAAEFNFDLMSDPAGFIAVGAERADLVRWSWILDVFGRYFLLVPAALYLWYWLKPKNPNLVSMYTVLGLAHILIGAMAGTLLASVWPPMMRAYAQASGTQREMLTVVFQATANLTHAGWFNILETIPGGFWLLGIGLILRTERRILGIATIVLGIASLVIGVETALGIEALAMPALFVYLFFAPVWALWLGLVIARDAGTILDHRMSSIQTGVPS